MKTNIKQWAKDHKKQLLIAGSGVGLLVIGALCVRSYSDKVYLDGVACGSAVSARACRKALNPTEEDISKVIDMIDEAYDEILAERRKKG